MAREEIKDFYGRILGYLEDDGDVIVARDFYLRILGRYSKSTDITSDFYGRMICRGNGLTGLIMQAQEKE